MHPKVEVACNALHIKPAPDVAPLLVLNGLVQQICGLLDRVQHSISHRSSAQRSRQLGCACKAPAMAKDISEGPAAADVSCTAAQAVHRDGRGACALQAHRPGPAAGP